MAHKNDDEINDIRIKANRLYSSKGQTAVKNMGEEMKLPFSTCVDCKDETPTLSDSMGRECLVCGCGKE